VPYAIDHGRNPLFSSWTNFPVGVNLAQNTNMPLLGLIAAPVTILASPVAAYNLLLWLAFPVSATAMYGVTRRWTGSRLAAISAGLLYGFSAYVVGQGVGHVMLSFVPLPPIYFYQLHKLLVRRQGKPYREGMVLGLIAGAQFFISSEIMASLLLMSLIGVVIYVIADRRSISREVALYAARGLATAGIVLAVLIGYPLWFILFGLQHFAEPVRPVDNVYHGVGLGPILPTLSQRLGLPVLSKYGHQLGRVENGQYLGIPLVLLTTLLVVSFRRNRALLLSASLAAVAFVLSLGLHLGLVHLGGSLPLPYTLLAHVPLVNNLLPERLSIYIALFVAVTVALGLAELTSPGARTGTGLHHSRSPRSDRARNLTVAGLGVLVVISLLPTWPYPSTAANIPFFFRSALVKHIPVNTVVLTYPFPKYPANQAMTWQAVTGMRFKEMGTYAFLRGPDGRATTTATLLPPTSVQQYLIYEELRSTVNPRIGRDQVVGDIRKYISVYGIGAVIVGISDPTVPNTPEVVAVFTQALGRPVVTGGVALWLQPLTPK
jgi:hypothetical protein